MNAILATALAVIVTAGLCLCLAVGGCRKSELCDDADGASTACAVAPGNGATPAKGPSLPIIGRDGAVIGRLEEPAVVRATLYRANEARGETTDVGLAEGTWLVPGSAIAAPAEVEE